MKCESCVYGVKICARLYCAYHSAHCPDTDEEVGNCKAYEPIKKPVTNFDKIRAMSDEELATWVETIAGCDLCPMLDEQCSGGEVYSRASCKHHWLDWLRQEDVADGV